MYPSLKPTLTLKKNIVNHVGQFHDPGICQLYSTYPSNKLGIFHYYPYIQAELQNSGGVIFPTRRARSTIHPYNIHKATSFTPASFPILPIKSITITKNTNTIHTILTIQINSIHYLYSVNFFPWKENTEDPCQMLNIEWNMAVQAEWNE